MTADELVALLDDVGATLTDARRMLAHVRSHGRDPASLPRMRRAVLDAIVARTQYQRLEVVERERDPSDGFVKYLLRSPDGSLSEAVRIPLQAEGRYSVCLSSQVGCAMGCVFCASGLGGVERNLTTGEITEQMLRLQQLLPVDERLSHVAVMGMGEPLANVDRLLPALELASASQGLGISPRRITISTVGLPHAMDKLTSLSARFQLAVSLHAADDALRDRLVPVNKNIGLHAILRAADRYFAASGRRLTFEYVLLAGENDGCADAHGLAGHLRGRPALLNLIPYNPVVGLPYRTPSRESVRQFREILSAAGVNVKVRQRKGDKINAACGQLRRENPARLHVS